MSSSSSLADFCASAAPFFRGQTCSLGKSACGLAQCCQCGEPCRVACQPRQSSNERNARRKCCLVKTAHCINPSGAIWEPDERVGDAGWLRLTEQWTATAKSVFLFDVQGSVAKSTYTGIPWLRYLQRECKRSIHFWPFDGWDIPHGSSVVAEVYPSLWMRRFPKGNRDSDSQAAYAAAAWLQRADLNGSLLQFLNPPLEPEERQLAAIEGWILGVV